MAAGGAGVGFGGGPVVGVVVGVVGVGVVGGGAAVDHDAGAVLDLDVLAQRGAGEALGGVPSGLVCAGVLVGQVGGHGCLVVECGGVTAGELVQGGGGDLRFDDLSAAGGAGGPVGGGRAWVVLLGSSCPWASVMTNRRWPRARAWARASAAGTGSQPASSVGYLSCPSRVDSRTRSFRPAPEGRRGVTGALAAP